MRITRAQALQIARAVWGKEAAIKDYGRIYESTPALRAAASAELQELRAKKIDMPGFLDEKKYADTMTLGEFRALWREQKAALDAWHKREDELQSSCWRQRYYVGTIGAIAFYIRGSGDSWEGALNKAGVTSERIEQILHPRKAAAKRSVAKLEEKASREEQQARYIDAGPNAWDDQ